MSVNVPLTLTKTTELESVVDAIYFVVRVLRNGLRGYRDPTVSTEAAGRAKRLAEKTIEEIETNEHRRISEISPSRATEYIKVIEHFLSERALETSHAMDTSGETILEEMRASGL